MTPLPANLVKEMVARVAGARPWDRDPIDQRIVTAALAGNGKIIDGETEVGGYPQRKASTAPFNAADWNLDDLQKLPVGRP